MARVTYDYYENSPRFESTSKHRSLNTTSKKKEEKKMAIIRRERQKAKRAYAE